MKIITIEEHLAGAPINQYLEKYAEEDAPYTAAAHGKGRFFPALQSSNCSRQMKRLA